MWCGVEYEVCGVCCAVVRIVFASFSKRWWARLDALYDVI